MKRLHELGERTRRRIAGHLEPNRVAAFATTQLLLDGLEQIFGLFFVDLDIEVARDTKHVKSIEFDAWEDGRDVASYKVLEQHVRARRGLPRARLDAIDRQEAPQHRRHLDDAETALGRALRE